MTTALSVVHIIVIVFLIAVVLLQAGKDAGMSGAISGGAADTFFGKNRKRTVDAILAKLTIVAAIMFVFTSLGCWMFLK